MLAKVVANGRSRGRRLDGAALWTISASFKRGPEPCLQAEEERVGGGQPISGPCRLLWKCRAGTRRRSASGWRGPTRAAGDLGRRKNSVRELLSGVGSKHCVPTDTL